MTSVSQQAEALERILEEKAVYLARETGFIERERAFNGADFVQALILGWLQRPDERVEGFVQMLERREVSISASVLSQRFTREAATFLQQILEQLTQEQMQAEAVDIPLLRRFRTVIVEDSSSVLLPAELAEVWQGCGSSHGTGVAAVKLFVRLRCARREAGGATADRWAAYGYQKSVQRRCPARRWTVPGRSGLLQSGAFSGLGSPGFGRETLFCDVLAIRDRPLHAIRSSDRSAWDLAAA